MMKEKIIQFGEGGFLRGFADWMLEENISEIGVCDGKIALKFNGFEIVTVRFKR